MQFTEEELKEIRIAVKHYIHRCEDKFSEEQFENYKNLYIKVKQLLFNTNK